MSKTHLHRIETGERALDSLSEIVALADALQIAPSELIRVPVPAPVNGQTDGNIESMRRVLVSVHQGNPGGTFPLGTGLVHGDAYPGNTLWDGLRPLLGDWDEVGIGPRELDLVNTHQGARFGRSVAERERFAEAYGYDVTAWPGFPVLREMRDLHTLASYVRLTDEGDEYAREQLALRLSTLKAGEDQAPWNAG